MSLKSILRKSKKNLVVLLLWNEYRRLCSKHQFFSKNDYDFVNDMYKNRTGHILNLSEPQRYTEKLQWLKLFYRDSDIERCSDKYTVRKYLEENGYGHILNDVIATYDSVNEIDLELLPQQFVLKVSHGSGWNIICKDKSKLNWNLYKLIINSWIKQNLYIYGREWNYKNLKPTIIIERYIDSGDGQLTDYKFFCFDGQPKFVQVDRDRFSTHKQSYYNLNWEQLPFSTGCLELEEARPKMFDEMKKIAMELSRPFPHVRIDFYSVEDRIYFGEFTFFDGSGFYNYEPDEWDYHWGTMLKLPQPNYNLSIYESIHKVKNNVNCKKR